MTNQEDRLDRILKQSLAADSEPDKLLNEQILMKVRERDTMKSAVKKKLSAGLIAAAVTVATSISVFAATQYFSSRDVAEHLGNKPLAQAFAGSDAVEINQSVVSGDYRFTLHGIVSGSNLGGMEQVNSAVRSDRTYTVVSIAKADGSPMPGMQDEQFGQEPFFATPLVRGQEPWRVNAASMGGGYSEFVADGVLYRLLETDGVEMFADRGLYVAIVNASFINNRVFSLDAESGDIRSNPDSDTAHALFELPIDKAKADPAKAEQYLQQLLGGKESAEEKEASRQTFERTKAEVERIYTEGKLIPDSVKELTVDANGFRHYSYDGLKASFSPHELFAEGQSGFSESYLMQEGDQSKMAVRFFKDEKGIITGSMYELKK